MRFTILLLACACEAPAIAPAPIAQPTPPAHRASCPAPTVPAPTWADWRTSGAPDPCERAIRCAQAGCAEAACLERYYGCLDSGTIATLNEEKLGAAFFVTVACCTN
jgi:hypothetical protein